MGPCGKRRSVLVDRVLLPPKDEFDRAARESLRPSGQSWSAAIGTAIEANAGLAFVHSHADSRHLPTLIAIDWETHPTLTSRG
jgi:hypothetical protein